MAQDNSSDQLFYRTRDVARILGVSETQVRIWQREGVLPVFRIPGLRAVRVTRAALDALAEKLLNGARR